MTIISPFTPLYFRTTRDRSGWASTTAQCFAATDKILIQAIADEGDEIPAIRLLAEDGEYPLEWNIWQINTEKKVLFVELVNLDEGEYSVAIADAVSEHFIVTTDESLYEDTVLIQYSMKDNRQRTDVATWIAGVQHFFSIRIPGGFKDDNWTFGVENEQFSTQDMDVLDIYSRETTQQSLTIGGAEGVPVWCAEKINTILCSTYCYIDGVRYTRSGSSTPEMQQTIEGQRSYIFNQKLQKVRFTDPAIEEANIIAMRIALSNNTKEYEPRESDSRIVIL